MLNLPPATTPDPTKSRGAIVHEHSHCTDQRGCRQKAKNLVEMNWDPITRIVGSLGIFTKIDFENRK